MTTSQQKTLTLKNPTDSHDITYFEWGTPGDQPTVICVHGLTRNAHDFDILAAHLASDQGGNRHVICPDIVGRGDSDHLSNPAHYDYAQYCADMLALIKHLGGKPVDWVGTSMGGLIGMMIAAMPQPPIRRFVINDVGPYLEAKALERIGTYTGAAPDFQSLDEIEAYLRHVHAPFAPMTDENWQDMAKNGARQTEAGTYRLTYDPKIGETLRASLTGEDVNLWPVWQMITAPVLLFRGGKSDLLSRETAEQMTKTGPQAELIIVEEAGHAPSLMADDQCARIGSWLAKA